MNLDENGTAQAAILSSAFGMLVLAVVNLGTEISDAFKNSVHAIGKLWMPGALGIGPYSGKETLALTAWLVSWFILHLILRKREWNNQVVFVVFLLLIALATTLIWPPIYVGIAETIKRG